MPSCKLHLPDSLLGWLHLLILTYAIFIILSHWRQRRPQNRLRAAPIPHPPGPDPSKQDQADLAIDIPGPRLPYNETTLVALITEIYRTYQKLNYITPDELIWPPAEGAGHAINEPLCAALHLDPAVISLMKRLPYPLTSRLAETVPITPLSRAFVYLEDEEIRGGRDPKRYGHVDELRGDVLRPHEIALSCFADEGECLVLDVEENTIRVWEWDGLPPSGDDATDLRAYHAHHAPTFLSEHLEKLRALQMIPCGHSGARGYWVLDSGEVYPRIKRTLQEQYGWPYDFRAAEWKAASEETWERLLRFDPAF
ncbi:hypothetical protein ASPACDRAFT_47591 [Aspergillus aculeatus ATCC 16872]|uniref:Uncharacterized protein n=1 Tax=Aspergillus aculeatus (strain ATCC 16872 / CBS 172.66 / WB 5094) TaxID=690307 RepID=A0A1L9WHS7_ASPA1|nr:uncharacterized protein ASPACDRAFT_47591 [Aspergillus aculeatus ATCC 16872]OJJ95700.1 hypothetical protein ASPACDRAFT_47591 [Aspergillus aculeatus ATCC 16872]